MYLNTKYNQQPKHKRGQRKGRSIIATLPGQASIDRKNNNKKQKFELKTVSNLFCR